MAAQGLQALAAHGLQALAAHGLHALAAQGLQALAAQGLQALAAHGLQALAAHGLQALAAQGLHALAAQGLHALAAQGLHALAAQGLQALAAQGLQALAAQGLSFLTAQGLQGSATSFAASTIWALGLFPAACVDLVARVVAPAITNVPAMTAVYRGRCLNRCLNCGEVSSFTINLFLRFVLKRHINCRCGGSLCPHRVDVSAFSHGCKLTSDTFGILLRT